jgi:phosphate transport system ATP-binding protein
MATTNSNFDQKYVIETESLDIFYGSFKAVTDVNVKVERNAITAIIGPSGCGKSTLLRAFNRMNELYAGTSIQGRVSFNGVDIYDREVDPVEVRYRIGMVFQKPNPFPKSIYENIAWTARIHGYKGKMDELVENSLRQAASIGFIALRRAATASVYCPRNIYSA